MSGKVIRRVIINGAKYNCYNRKYFYNNTFYYFGIINNTPLNNPFAFVVSLGFVMLFSCIVYLTIIFKIDF